MNRQGNTSTHLLPAMPTYTYFQAPTGTVYAVKDGFSWPAFLFGPLWALVKRAWREFTILSVAYVGLFFIDESFVQRSRSLPLLLLMLLAYIAFMTFCGKYGNAWLRTVYERKGYKRLSATSDA